MGTQIFMTREKRKQQRIEIVTAAVKAGIITEEAGQLLLEKLQTREKKETK